MALQSLRDEPNTSREYETTYILRPDTNTEGVAEINARVRTVIEERGGAIVKVDNWGKRKLAYEIRKELKGIYLFWHYLAKPGVVEEIERNLRMLDTCIRYYTIKIDEDVDVSTRPSEFSDDDFAKASQTAADEEDIVSAYRGGEGGQDGEAAAASEGESAVKAEAKEGDTEAAAAPAAEATATAEVKAEVKAEAADTSEPVSGEAVDDKSSDDEKGQE